MNIRAIGWMAGAAACYVAADFCINKGIREYMIRKTAETWSQTTSDTKESSSSQSSEPPSPSS